MFLHREGKAVDIKDRELTILDEILQEISDRTDDADILMREHLETARYYRVGAMPDEYHFNLGLIKKLLPKIQDRQLHSKIADFLRMEQQPETSSAS
jgi:hypothetical protein